jgi:hypothetical protein
MLENVLFLYEKNHMVLLVDIALYLLCFPYTDLFFHVLRMHHMNICYSNTNKNLKVLTAFLCYYLVHISSQ